MLYEILSDVFISHGQIRPPIRFENGLNVVQGTESGSNSIGKSTFLLAIDFAFGGEDYAKQPTIQTEIGGHVVKFCFIFGSVPYYFSRSTDEITTVKVRDASYSPTGEMKLEEFRQRLFDLYKINLPNTTFRNVVGRYFRIYGRDNIDEKRPLEADKKEKGESAIAALLKLYNRYAAIAAQHENLEKKDDERDAFSKAQNFGFLTKISATDYKQNLARLETLRKELEELAEKGDTEFVGVDATLAEQAAELQSKLTALRRQRGRHYNNFYAVRDVAALKRAATEHDFQSLTRYFPNANVRDLQEIETFHSEITDVLASEFEEAKKTALDLAHATEREIEEAEAALKALNVPQKMTRATLTAFSKIERQIEAIEEQNKLYLQKKAIDDEYKIMKEQFELLSAAQISFVQDAINMEMARINDVIYSGKNKPPRLNITKLNNYGFFTPVDDGTGTNFKNLAVFDLSTLNLTPLPALAHDTVIFKNIAVEPMGKIIELYGQSAKQIFISFDRTNSYLATTQTIIESHTRLRLSSGGNELYGRSWNVKSVTE